MSKLRLTVAALAVILILSTNAFAAPPSDNPFKDFIVAVETKIAGVVAKFEKFEIYYAEGVLARASDFLDEYRGKTDFDLKTAEVLAEDLYGIASRTSYRPSLRSQAFLLLAGVDGKIAEKLGLPAGLDRGKAAFRALRFALALDPTSTDAARSYGMTISGFWSQNLANRFFIERGLGIDLKQESRAARRALERLGMTAEPCYADLGKHLN